jgi:archaeosine-15-forming tRNA-guanine transglycosylase
VKLEEKENMEVLDSVAGQHRGTHHRERNTRNHTRLKVFFFLLAILVVLVPAVGGIRYALAADGDFGTLDVSNFRMWVNDEELSDSGEATVKVKDGDEVSVYLEWSVENNAKDSSGNMQLNYSAEIDTKGITFNDESGDLYSDGSSIGTYELKNENGKSVFYIYLDKEKVAEKSNLTGGALLYAVISMDEDGEIVDGSEQNVGVADKTFKVIYDSGIGAGTVTVSKKADGSITYDEATKTYYQGYKVTVNAKGQVKDIVLSDTPSGGVLNLVADSLTVTCTDNEIKGSAVTIVDAGVITEDTDSSVVKVTSDTVTADNVDETAAFTLTLPANTRKFDDKTYTITYKMAIGSDVMENYTKTANNADVSYKDNGGTDNKSTAKATITPKKPTIAKKTPTMTLDEETYTMYMEWTITVDMGTRYAELTGDDLENIYVTDSYKPAAISGPPFDDMTYYDADSLYQDSDGKTVYVQKIPLSKFTPDGNGKYTYKYKTSSHFFSNYNTNTTYTNTASITPFEAKTPTTSTVTIDSRDIMNVDNMAVKEPVSITYVDENGEERTTEGTSAVTYGDYARVAWKLTVDFGKIPDISISGPTQWTSFIIRDELCGSDGVTSAYHKFNCTCTNGHNPGTCPSCNYCSNDYMSFQVVDASGNVVQSFNIKELYSSDYAHDSVTINEDSWSMDLMASGYTKFSDLVSNDYKLVITYNTIVDADAVAEIRKANGSLEGVYNSATIESVWCGTTFIQSGISGSNRKVVGDLSKNVSIGAIDKDAPKQLTTFIKSYISDAVVVGDNTYSYSHDNYIGWVLKLDKRELTEGATLTVHDTPGANTTYVEDSLVIYDSRGSTGSERKLINADVKVTVNDDGSVDFDFGEITDEWLENPDSYYYVCILYQTKIDEAAWYAQYPGLSKSYSNSVEGTYNNGTEQSLPKVASNCNVAPPKVVKKTGEVLTASDGGTSEYKAKYTIDINPMASDLAYGESKLKATDVMSSTFILDSESVKVYRDSVKDENLITDYTMKYDKDENTITFVVPNNMHVIITYDVNVNTEAIEDPTWFLDTNNTVSIEAFKVNESDSKVSFSKNKTFIRAWAYNTEGNITIYKYWNNAGEDVPLSGATFKLYSVYDNTGHKYTESDSDYVIRDNITIDSDSGKVIVTDLPLDRVYRLVEVSEPDGCLKGEDYYFVLKGHSGVEVPDELLSELGVKELPVYTEESTIEYENTRKGSIVITKTLSGDVTDADIETLKSKISFKVSNADGDSVGEFTLADFTYDKTTGTYTKEVAGLEEGTYSVEETAYDINGKTRTTTYSLSTRVMSEKDEDVIVNDASGEKAEKLLVSNGTFTEVDFTNHYENDKGNLKITKTTTGNVTPDDTQFVITYPDGTTKTVNYSEFTAVKDETAGDAGETASDGDEAQGSVQTTKEYVLEGLLVGDYTVTEIQDGAKVTDYKLTVTGKIAGDANGSDNAEDDTAGSDVTSWTATVEKNETAEVIITNTYVQDTGSIKITKTISGDADDTDEDVLASISFTVTDKDGKTVATLNLNDKKFTYDKSSGKYVAEIKDLPVGKYTVEETAKDITGKTMTVKYAVISESEGTAESVDENSTENVNGDTDSTENAGGALDSADDTTGNGSSAEVAGADETADPASSQYTTGNKAENVAVTDGDVTEVAFENTYVNDKGKLKITKTTTGNETPENAEFIITYPDGKTTKTVKYSEFRAVKDEVATGSDDTADSNDAADNDATTGRAAGDSATDNATTENDSTDNGATATPGNSATAAGTTADKNNSEITREYILEDLVVGDYTITETGADVKNYTLTVTGSKSDDGTAFTATVEKDKTAEISITNTYVQDKGNLKITKISTGNATPADTEFVITYPDGTTKKTVKYSDFTAIKDETTTDSNSETTGDSATADKTQNSNQTTMEYVLENVPVGDYTVTEIQDGAKVTDYKLTVTGKIAGDANAEADTAGSDVTSWKATVEKNKTAEVIITNTYVQNTGSIKITKTISGDVDDTDEDVLASISFTVTDKDGKTVASLKLTDDEFKYVKSSGKYVAEITDLPVGKYTVEETAKDITGKSMTVKYAVISESEDTVESVDANSTENVNGDTDSTENVGGALDSADDTTENESSAETAGADETADSASSQYTTGNKAENVAVSDGKVTEVAFKNTYVNDKGKLKITKTTTGNATPESAEFIITYPDGKTKQTVKYSDFADVDNTQNNSEITREYVLEDLVVGDYTVTETGADVKNYTLTVTGATSDEKTAFTATVEKDETAEISITNTYVQKKGSIIFTKVTTYKEKCAADSDAVKPLKGATFSLYDETGKVFIKDALSDDEGEVVFEDLDIGTYVIKETAVPDGYVISEETFTAVVEDENTTAVLLDGDGTPVKNNQVVNEPVTVDITLVKVNELNHDETLEGSTYGLFASDDDTKALTDDDKIAEATTDEDGRITFKGLLMGRTYTIRELKAPDGSYVSEKPISIKYRIGEDGKVEIESADFGTSERNADTASIDENGNIVWYEPPVVYQFDKVDEDGVAVAGAELVLKDEDGNVIDSWKTDKSSHKVEGLLIAGKTYTLSETKAPEGYEIADDIKFTVDVTKEAGEKHAVTIRMTDKKKSTTKPPETTTETTETTATTTETTATTTETTATTTETTATTTETTATTTETTATTTETTATTTETTATTTETTATTTETTATTTETTATTTETTATTTETTTTTTEATTEPPTTTTTEATTEPPTTTTTEATTEPPTTTTTEATTEPPTTTTTEVTTTEPPTTIPENPPVSTEITTITATETGNVTTTETTPSTDTSTSTSTSTSTVMTTETTTTTEETPDKPSAPSTGDDAIVIPIVIIFFASLTGGVMVLLNSKKKDDSIDE